MMTMARKTTMRLLADGNLVLTMNATITTQATDEMWMNFIDKEGGSVNEGQNSEAVV